MLKFYENWQDIPEYDTRLLAMCNDYKIDHYLWRGLAHFKDDPTPRWINGDAIEFIRPVLCFVDDFLNDPDGLKNRFYVSVRWQFKYGNTYDCHHSLLKRNITWPEFVLFAAINYGAQVTIDRVLIQSSKARTHVKEQVTKDPIF